MSVLLRHLFWRAVLTVTGGLRVGSGTLPEGPCVIVCNHSSHADTVALLAALPAGRRPAVAAAADYWFERRWRRLVCRAMCGAFPVRRSGGGSADLAMAARLLAAGRDVIVFPEGTRSRDGSPARFHSGAARLAHMAGVPLVPAGITGTRQLLPPPPAAPTPPAAPAVPAVPAVSPPLPPSAAARPRLPVRRATITIRFGTPVAPGDPHAATAQAREQVIALTSTLRCFSLFSSP
jgi:1-acyl-sn-glycerol-3-phosphate acyltransferase